MRATLTLNGLIKETRCKNWERKNCWEKGRREKNVNDFPASIYLSKKKKVWNIFKVNNKYNRRTPTVYIETSHLIWTVPIWNADLVLVFLFLTLNIFDIFFSVSIIEFEQVNVSWAKTENLLSTFAGEWVISSEVLKSFTKHFSKSKQVYFNNSTFHCIPINRYESRFGCGPTYCHDTLWRWIDILSWYIMEMDSDCLKRFCY